MSGRSIYSTHSLRQSTTAQTSVLKHFFPQRCISYKFIQLLFLSIHQPSISFALENGLKCIQLSQNYMILKKMENTVSTRPVRGKSITFVCCIVYECKTAVLIQLNPLRGKWPIEPALISGFCSVKRMRVFDYSWMGH